MKLNWPMFELLGTGAMDVEATKNMLSASKGVLLDWDGCVAIGNRPERRAIEFIREHAEKIAIISNNSTNLPKDFAQVLAAAGAPVAPDRIILAGVEAILRAAEMRPASVMILGDSRMKVYARDLGLRIVPDNADLIVLLRDTRFSYSKLERAANCINAGARLIVANPDVTHPGPNGRAVPETGAIYAALTACVGEQNVKVEVIGKPSPRLFERGCHALCVARESAVMIGDNPATDIAGANAFGMRSVLIGSHSEIGLGDLLETAMSESAR